MDFESQLRRYEPRPFPAGAGDADGLGAEPRWEDFAPAQPAGADPEEGPARSLLDSGYQRGLAQARLTHQRALREWRTRRAEAVVSGEAESRRAHEEAEQARARAVREYNDSLEECRRAYRLAEPAAVESLIERALAAAESATQDLPVPCRAVFRSLTRTVVLDLDLPPLDLVPALSGYRLTPEGDILPVPRPPGTGPPITCGWSPGWRCGPCRRRTPSTPTRYWPGWCSTAGSASAPTPRPCAW